MLHAELCKRYKNNEKQIFKAYFGSSRRGCLLHTACKMSIFPGSFFRRWPGGMCFFRFFFSVQNWFRIVCFALPCTISCLFRVSQHIGKDIALWKCQRNIKYLEEKIQQEWVLYVNAIHMSFTPWAAWWMLVWMRHTIAESAHFIRINTAWQMLFVMVSYEIWIAAYGILTSESIDMWIGQIHHSFIQFNVTMWASASIWRGNRNTLSPELIALPESNNIQIEIYNATSLPKMWLLLFARE